MTPSSVSVRAATAADIESMHGIRLAVDENRLSDSSGISKSSYVPYLEAGSGWVAEMSGAIVGFAIVDALEHSVWALFVGPATQEQGVGRALHERILKWSREQGIQRLSLTTSPDTRAARFYRRLGWSDVGYTDDGDVRFERLT